jgi:hypothetical protein
MARTDAASKARSVPRHNRWKRVGTGHVLVAAALALPGCTDPGSIGRQTPVVEVAGYTNRPLFRDDIRTVAVPIFKTGRTLFRRGLEMQLTEAVIKQIESRTPYKVVPRDRADTVLDGEVLAFTERVLTETPRNEPREVQVTVTVRMLWRDLRSGEVLREARRLSENATFVVDVGETEAQATLDSFDDLVERIVELLETDF